MRPGKIALKDFARSETSLTQVITAPEQSNSILAHQPSVAIVGTPEGYKAPTEQGSRGRPQPNSDIYALGMIAIQALTGVTPTQLHEELENGEIMCTHLVDVSEAIASCPGQRWYATTSLNRYSSATATLVALKQLELTGEAEGYQEAEEKTTRYYNTQVTTHPHSLVSSEAINLKFKR